MKLFDIAFKDMLRSYRSAMGIIFMLVVPLFMTGMFALMFGSRDDGGDFSLPPVSVVVANLDRDAPRLGSGSGNVPGGIRADTMSDLVVEVLRSDEMEELLQVSMAPDAATARAAVDSRQVQVAVIIPKDFSRQFADLYGEAQLEFYQDPTLTLGPGIVRAILNQFMDGLSAVKIAVDLALETAGESDYALVGQFVQRYLETSTTQVEDLGETLLEQRSPVQAPQSEGTLVHILGPIMGGMMIFYAFFTGASTAESILREEEERTLPRLFTTPTARSTILAGKFLSVFLTVLVQVVVLLVTSHYLFGISWGKPVPLVVLVGGLVLSAATFGIFVNSLLKSTKQSGVIFGGVLTVTGMLGMIRIFAMGSPNAAVLGNSVSLLVPQGWVVRGLLQVMGGQTLMDVLLTTLVLLVWSALFFATGVWRFRRRYA